MERSIGDETLTPLLEEVFLKMIREKRDVFYDVRPCDSTGTPESFCE